MPGNKLCMAVYFHLIEKLAGWDAHCAAHNLHLVWKDGASECDFDNPLYCLSKLLTHAGTGTKVQQGMIAAAETFQILVGVPPPPDHGFNDTIAKYTFLRPLLTGSYLKRPGTARHCVEEIERMRTDLQGHVDIVHDAFNAPWHLDAGAHYC